MANPEVKITKVGDWMRTVRPTKGKNPIPVGLTGRVFWIGKDFYNNIRVGLDLNGEGDGAIFVNAQKLDDALPEAKPEPKGQMPLDWSPERTYCPDCSVLRCSDGCCCGC